MQKILDDFAIGSMNYARARITMPVEMGGLGLFDIEKFLISQQVGWIFKAHKSSRDNWRYKLRSLCNGNVLIASPEIIKKVQIQSCTALAVAMQDLELVMTLQTTTFKPLLS